MLILHPVISRGTASRFAAGCLILAMVMAAVPRVGHAAPPDGSGSYDDLMSHGRIPVALIRYEMTGLDDDMDEFWSPVPLSAFLGRQ